ncbi:MAG: FAD-binding oxidoreductase [Bacteroidia bacterium]
MKKCDYIIIGAGLAGTILADFLSKKASVVVFDKEAGEYGSKVAAGIYNPVTGRRMVKSWMVDTFAPFALDYYRQKEKEINQKLIDVIDIQRLFHNVQQRNEWLERVDFDQLQEIIRAQIEPDSENRIWFKEHGGVTTATSWRLNTVKYLDAWHGNWLKSGQLIRESIDYGDIKVNGEQVRVNDIEAKRVIFCEGWNIGKNPWFDFLPIKPNKGELLTIEAKGLDVNDMVQKRIFVLPIGEDKYKVGATYDRENHDYLPTEKAKWWLLERLDNIIKVPYKILSQKAGIRPASVDRRPFVGQHPEFKSLFVFNGFGSKGVHQMPWSANHFVKVLEEGAELNSEMSIQRFSDRQ